jgi:hypothetical protein
VKNGVAVTDDDRKELFRAGLCFTCAYARRVESARGALFYRCGYSDIDPSFSKYPQLPMLECPAYERAEQTSITSESNDPT